MAILGRSFPIRPHLAQQPLPTIAPQNVALPVGTLTLTGVPPTAAPGGVSVALPVGALTFTGVPPTQAPSGAAPAPLPVGALTLTGVPPTAAGSGAISTTLPVGALTLTGVAPVAALDTGGEFCDDFNRANSSTPGGSWGPISDLGGTGGDWQLLSNKAQTNNATSAARDLNYAFHGLTLTTEMQVDLDMEAALDVGKGGIAIWMLSSTTGDGYYVFVGNAVHIYIVNVGVVGSALTNDGRPGGGANIGASLANQVTWTWTVGGTNNLQVFLDAVLWSQVTDTTHSLAGTDLIFIEGYDDDPLAPSREAYIDNLCLFDTISGPPAPTQSVALPTGALTFAGVAPTAAASGAAAAPLPVGALALAGVAPTANGSGATSVTLPVGALVLGGVAPTAAGSGAATVTLPVGALTLTGVAPVASVGTQFATLPVGTLTFTGVAPTAAPSGAAPVTLPVGALTLTGNAPTANGSGAVTKALPIGALTLTGVPLGAVAGGQFVTLPVGALTLTGVPLVRSATGTATTTLPVGVLVLAGNPLTAGGTGIAALTLPTGQLALIGVAPSATGVGSVARLLPVGLLTFLGVPIRGVIGAVGPFPATSVGGHLAPHSTGDHLDPSSSGGHLVGSSTGGHHE